MKGDAIPLCSDQCTLLQDVDTIGCSWRFLLSKCAPDDLSQYLAGQGKHVSRVLLECVIEDLAIGLTHIPGDNRGRLDLDGAVIPCCEHWSNVGVAEGSFAHILSVDLIIPLAGSIASKQLSLTSDRA